MLEEFDINAVFARNQELFGDTRMETESAPEGGGETAPAPESSAQGEESTGGNPAWQSILDVLPDSLHNVVRPALEKWDQGVQQGYQKVHSQYEPYKPLLDAGYDPQDIQYALAVIDKLENDPRSIYDALAEHNGWAAEQGQSGNEVDPEDYDPENVPDDPRITRAESMAEAVAEYVMAQHEERQAAEEDAALDQHITSLKAEHGIAEDDAAAEKFVMGLMLAGATAEQAFDEYDKLTQGLVQRPRANDNAPVVLGGGGVPSTAINREAIQDPKNRKALVAQMLAQANS